MKLNFKKAITRMIVKGYGISMLFCMLFCMLLFAIGLALLIAPALDAYQYHESHFVCGLVSVVLSVSMLVAFAIPTKRDRRNGL